MSDNENQNLSAIKEPENNQEELNSSITQTLVLTVPSYQNEIHRIKTKYAHHIQIQKYKSQLAHKQTTMQY